MAGRSFSVKERGKGSRREKSVYLIIAEGRNKTETQYLSHFQKHENDYNIKFVSAGSKTDAISLYETMVLRWKEQELSIDKGDRGFIVLDIDNDRDKAAKVQNLIKKNKNPGIEFVVSNPTFEVWLLLHFTYTTKYYKNSQEVIMDLKKYIPDYEKNLDVFTKCEERIQEAIQNTEKLEKYFKDRKWPAVECNPRTDVGEMVKLLSEKI